MAFNFLGNPTVDEIEELKDYLNIKYDQIDQIIKGKETEIGSLSILRNKLLCAEGKLNSLSGKKNKDFALTNYLTRPLENEDASDFFEQHRYDGASTAVIIEKLQLPFREQIKRETETLEYKIRKVQYLIELRKKEIAFLQETKAGLRDEG